jgi:hypothetical protein
MATQKTVLDIIAQPNTLQATLKSGNWQTKLNKSIIDNIIKIDEADRGLNINDTFISNATMQAKSLQLVADGTETLQSWLSYMSQECISSMQLTSKNGAVEKISKPLAGHVMTSSELRQASFKLVEASTIEAIYNQLVSLSDKDTKQGLLDKIELLKSLIITPERLESIQTLETKEAEFKAKFTVIETIFNTITSITNTCNYTARIEANALKDGIVLLTQNKFELVGIPVISADFNTFLITFTNFKESTI